MKGYWGASAIHINEKKLLLDTDGGQSDGNGWPSLIISPLLISCYISSIPYVDYVSAKKNSTNVGNKICFGGEAKKGSSRTLAHHFYRTGEHTNVTPFGFKIAYVFVQIHKYSSNDEGDRAKRKRFGSLPNFNAIECGQNSNYFWKPKGVKKTYSLRSLKKVPASGPPLVRTFLMENKIIIDAFFFTRRNRPALSTLFEGHSAQIWNTRSALRSSFSFRLHTSSLLSKRI